MRRERTVARVVMARGRRDERDEPGEYERECDDLEDRQAEPAERVVARHRHELEGQGRVREHDESTRHPSCVPARPDAEEREREGRAEREGVVEVCLPVDRHRADPHETEADQSDEHPHRRAGPPPDCEAAEGERPGERARQARHARARDGHGDVEARRGEVVRGAERTEVVRPPVARRGEAHARETAGSEQHRDEVEGAVRLVVEGVPVQAVGAEAEGRAEQAPDRAMPARQRFERRRGEVHGEQGQCRPGESVRDRARTGGESGQAQVRDRREPGVRGRHGDERRAHRSPARECGNESDDVEGARGVERGGRERASEHDRDRHGDEHSVEPAHERNEAPRMTRRPACGRDLRPTMPLTVGCARVHRAEARREPRVERGGDRPRAHTPHRSNPRSTGTRPEASLVTAADPCHPGHGIAAMLRSGFPARVTTPPRGTAPQTTKAARNREPPSSVRPEGLEPPTF